MTFHRVTHTQVKGTVYPIIVNPWNLVREFQKLEWKERENMVKHIDSELILPFITLWASI